MNQVNDLINVEAKKRNRGHVLIMIFLFFYFSILEQNKI